MHFKFFNFQHKHAQTTKPEAVFKRTRREPYVWFFINILKKSRPTDITESIQSLPGSSLITLMAAKSFVDSLLA